MNWKIMRSVVITLASLWSTQILADGGRQLQAPRALQEAPSAERVDKIAQTTQDQCVTCCTRNQAACYKRNEDVRLCELKHTKCVAHCSKQGRMPSDWFCWWQPQMTW
jgi:hypothetical protein